MRWAMSEGAVNVVDFVRVARYAEGMKLRECNILTTPPQDLNVNQLRKIVLVLRERLHEANHTYGTIPSAILIEGTTLDGAPELAILTVAVG